MKKNMSSSERVTAALNHEEPDRVPQYDIYNSDFLKAWTKKGLLTELLHTRNDVIGIRPNQGPWPSEAKVIRETDEYIIFRDEWGMTLKSMKYTDKLKMDQPLKARIEDPADLDKYPWESADSPARWRIWKRDIESKKRSGKCIQIRVGGPFNRSSRIRGYDQFMVDLIRRPNFAEELMDRFVDLQAEIGIRALKDPLFEDVHPKYVQCNDEIASTTAPMVSPRLYRRMILPRLKRLVERLKKEGGAEHVQMQADGNVRPLVDLYLEAGITALRSVEPRAGMDPLELKKTYGKRLCLVGAIDNNIILPSGDKKRIKEHVLYTLQAGRGGGLIIGPESISGDVSIESIQYYFKLLDIYGRYPLNLEP